MTRNDLFILTLQTLLSGGSPKVIVRCLDSASVLPPEALGEMPAAQAALDYFTWQASDNANPRYKPKWLTEYESAAANRVIVRINPDSISNNWWMHAEAFAEEAAVGAAPMLPDVFKPLIFDRDVAVMCTRKDADLFRQWVESVPGYEELPFLFEQAPAQS